MKRIHRNNILATRVIDFFIIGAYKAGTNMWAGNDEGQFLQDVYSIALASIPTKLSPQSSSNGAVVAVGGGARNVWRLKV